MYGSKVKTPGIGLGEIFRGSFQNRRKDLHNEEAAFNSLVIQYGHLYSISQDGEFRGPKNRAVTIRQRELRKMKLQSPPRRSELSLPCSKLQGRKIYGATGGVMKRQIAVG